MTDRTPITKLRKQILEARGVTPEPKTKRLLKPEELPDLYPKTPQMKLIELRYKVRLEQVIFKGSLLDICKQFNWEIDKSTVSRWRKHIRHYIGKVYYE